MIRMIFVETDASPMMGGAPVPNVSHKTFTVDLPDIEAWLDEYITEKSSFVMRSFIGIERVDRHATQTYTDAAEQHKKEQR